MKDLWQSRKFRQGSISSAITVIVVALLIIFNMIISLLTDRYNLTIDLTPGQLFSISDESKQYLAALTKEVTIYAMDTEENLAGLSEQSIQTLELLKKYAQQSRYITLEFIDLVANPAFAQQYPDMTLYADSILITSGENVRLLSTYDLYNIEYDVYGQSVLQSSKSEQALTGAILSVTSNQTVRAAIITGHNEEPLPALTELLASNNYLTEQVNIATSEIDADHSVAVIAAPQRDFTEEELRRLDKFLENNGQYGRTLLYFASSQQTDTPALNAFLADWGIAAAPGLVFESNPSLYLPGNPYIALVEFDEEVYASTALSAGTIPIASYARPLSALFASQGDRTTQTLLQFSDSAGIAVQDVPQETTGEPIAYGILAQSTIHDGTTLSTSQVVAFGSASFADPTFISNPNFANASYLISLLDSLTGQEKGIVMQPKELMGEMMMIDALQAQLLSILLVGVLPLALLVTGLVIWIRRRHR